jgi:hypothetical protein
MAYNDVVVGCTRAVERSRGMATARTGLEELLDPVGACLTPEVARRIAELRAPTAIQSRIEDLAARCSEDTLSNEEKQEYESLVSAATFIAILQSKARQVLRRA